MDDNFKLRAALKSNEELQNYIDNREKYLPESVEAAVAELQHRGVEFSDEELTVIAEDMQARRTLAEIGSNSFGLFTGEAKNSQVEDPDAPSFFSKGAILLFSIFFSVFVGSILMASNVRKSPNKDNANWVVPFGLGFNVLISIISPQNIYLYVIFGIAANCAGAYFMEIVFWNNYIGAATLYKRRSVLIPLVIVLAITLPLSFLFYFYGKELMVNPTK